MSTKTTRTMEQVSGGHAGQAPGDRPRETDGWRRGRPVEDPQKTKRWGIVSARPSEYLVHVRRGRLRERTSGQGASCFKWPWDAVAVVPTSLQRLRFVADQVTREKVGVEVTGLAVYRIADPRLAFRVLNFSFPERAQEKLESTLTPMLIGATRRLIANLGVEDCLQKRKDALATELLREVAPVVGGFGKPSDATDRGWGVVIDTIEIQDVRVLSDRVFAAMQAPFRAQVDRAARDATADAERLVAEKTAACDRAIEEARIAAALEIERKKREQALAEAESRRERELRDLAIWRETEEAKLESQRELARRQHALERETEEARIDGQRELARLQHALEREAAELEIAKSEALSEAQALSLAREQQAWDARAATRRGEMELHEREGKSAAAVLLAEAEAKRVLAEARAAILRARNLPKLAAAVGQKISEVRLTQLGGDANPYALVGQAIDAVLQLVRKS